MIALKAVDQAKLMAVQAEDEAKLLAVKAEDEARLAALKVLVSVANRPPCVCGVNTAR